MTTIERGTIVVLTNNRRVQLLQTLRSLSQLPEGWPIIVMDNGSSDGTAKAVAKEFPAALLIRSRRDIGAAARNIAVAYVHTPYVAFCDDDMQWEPGALQRAVEVLDRHPQVGLLNAAVLEGSEGRLDPLCARMAASPLDREHLPGPQLLGFMAGACIARTRAFYDAGGYWAPLFAGGEERLLSFNLAEREWRIVYMEDVVARRFSGHMRNRFLRERFMLRNAIWVAWLRLPFRLAWRETIAVLQEAGRARRLRAVVMLTLPGMTRVLRQRRVVTPRVAAMWACLAAAAPMPEASANTFQGMDPLYPTRTRQHAKHRL